MNSQKSKQKSNNSQSDIESEDSLLDCPNVEEDGFLNHESEMYTYLQRPEYTAEKVQVNSVQDVIEDFERKQRNLENLKFSVVEMQRKFPTC